MKVQVHRWGANSEPLFLLNRNQTCDTSLRQMSKLVWQLQKEILGLSITPCHFGCLCQSNNYNTPSDDTEQPTYNTKANYTTFFRLLTILFLQLVFLFIAANTTDHVEVIYTLIAMYSRDIASNITTIDHQYK